MEYLDVLQFFAWFYLKNLLESLFLSQKEFSDIAVIDKSVENLAEDIFAFKGYSIHSQK